MTPDERELQIWFQDQRINARGIYVDEKAARNAKNAVDRLTEKLTREIAQITQGKVSNPNSVKEITEFCGIDNCRSETVDDLLMSDNLEPVERRVLEIRRACSKASTAKLSKMLSCRNSDGRIRGLYQYHGAHTGRPAGRSVQPTNLPRPQFKYALEIARMFMRNDLDAIKLFYEDETIAAADALRSMFMAAPGYTFYCADFSAIEAVVTAGLAGEQWKLDAFRALVNGGTYEGAEDIYCAAAQKILQRSVSKKEAPEDRQVGKMCELSFGFEGGVGAYYRFDPKTPFTRDEIDDFKNAWREQHPMIKRLWKGLNNAAIDAVLYGEAGYRDIGFEKSTLGEHDILAMVMPNGKKTWYFKPRLVENPTPWGAAQLQLRYEGRLNEAGKAPLWCEVDTYGGKLTENGVQTLAREIQMAKMLELEAAGFGVPVMHTYDEVVVEVPEDLKRYEEFLSIMAEMPDYAARMPIGVDGWQGERYRK